MATDERVSNRIDFESDGSERLVVKDVAAIEEEGRLRHGRVDAGPVEGLERICAGAARAVHTVPQGSARGCPPHAPHSVMIAMAWLPAHAT